MLARRSSGKQKDRYICAPNDQQHNNRSEKKNNGSRETTEHLFIQRDNLHLHALRIVLQIFFGEPVNQDLHFGLRDRVRRLWFELDERVPVIVWIGIGKRGQVDVVVAPCKPLRRYTDDGVRRVVQLDRLSNHVAACTKLPLPEE